MKFYDFVIAGAGCSGLSLATGLAKANINKSILLIDSKIDTIQDKTWCFWDDSSKPKFPFPVTTWQNISFHTSDYEKKEGICPYKYYGIRSVDFYKYCYEVLQDAVNIDIVEDNIERIYGYKSGACLETKNQKYYAQYIFNSTVTQNSESTNTGYYSGLKQHFKGWLIKTERPVFDKNTLTFMDFRTNQHNDVRFFYVLPYSEKEALVEYTVFSNQILSDEEYEANIKSYIQKTLSIEKYSIIEKEKGIIPMDFISPEYSNEHIIPIGIEGGALKPSTGFAFSLIQKQVNEIIISIQNEKFIFTKKSFHNRFAFYDKILLFLLQNDKIDKSGLFISLFKGNSMRVILTFLSEKTNIFSEIKIFSSLPVKIFLKAVADIYMPKKNVPKTYFPIYQSIR
jgi:lycopene beta-cyclase